MAAIHGVFNTVIIFLGGGGGEWPHETGDRYWQVAATTYDCICSSDNWQSKLSKMVWHSFTSHTSFQNYSHSRKNTQQTIFGLPHGELQNNSTDLYSSSSNIVDNKLHDAIWHTSFHNYSHSRKNTQQTFGLPHGELQNNSTRYM